MTNIGNGNDIVIPPQTKHRNSPRPYAPHEEKEGYHVEGNSDTGEDRRNLLSLFGWWGWDCTRVHETAWRTAAAAETGRATSTGRTTSTGGTAGGAARRTATWRNCCWVHVIFLMEVWTGLSARDVTTGSHGSGGTPGLLC